ncbi:MAG: VWA domain-containing protein [Acidobacteriota bacterium]
MFSDFFFFLRACGLKVSLTEWLSLMRALALGHSRADLRTFYSLARSLLVKREVDFDLYDRAFATFFHGVENQFEVDDELLAWLADPKLPDLASALPDGLELEDLKRLFEERREEQQERHDGGNRWIGTGGTSPFGHGGRHPTGVRVGGPGGGRSAVQVAGERRFRNLRGDRILDSRQIGMALRRLRRLGQDEGPEELDVEATVDASARSGGDIDLVFAPPRRNRIQLLLLMDVGGSMDPHTALCERLFTAAHAAQHFKRFEVRFFHNCVYERLYTDMAQGHGERTADRLKQLDERWSVIFVGDAWMAPWELTHVGGAIDYFHHNDDTGLRWLQRIRRRCPDSVWLNPEPQRIWQAPSIDLIRHVFPMYELSLEGLAEAIDVLRGVRPNRPMAA